LLYLDLNREWRIGATANRILALALSNGSSFRSLRDAPPDVGAVPCKTGAQGEASPDVL